MVGIINNLLRLTSSILSFSQTLLYLPLALDVNLYFLLFECLFTFFLTFY